MARSLRWRAGFPTIQLAAHLAPHTDHYSTSAISWPLHSRRLRRWRMRHGSIWLSQWARPLRWWRARSSGDEHGADPGAGPAVAANTQREATLPHPQRSTTAWPHRMSGLRDTRAKLRGEADELRAGSGAVGK